MKNKVKRYIIDTAGVLLIIGAGLLGWLPGPGGIPLLLAGLGLLAINNKWAENILIKLRDKGEDLVVLTFPKNKKIQLLHDLTTFILISLGITLLVYGSSKYISLLGFPITILGISEFLFNRDRISKIKHITLKLTKNIIAFFNNLF